MMAEGRRGEACMGFPLFLYINEIIVFAMIGIVFFWHKLTLDKPVKTKQASSQFLHDVCVCVVLQRPGVIMVVLMVSMSGFREKGPQISMDLFSLFYTRM